MAKILIVEDEKKIARFLELELKHEGYEVITAFDGRSGLETALEANPDLLILDLMLPELSGIEVCRRLRHTSDVPIIMLTAKDDVSDKVMGLDMGADDYVTKPFAIEELLARIRVALKLHPLSQSSGAAPSQASPEKANGQLTWGPLILDIPRHRVTMNGHEISLTNREFLMLQTLLENTDIVLSRDTLLEKVCGYDYVGETNVIDVYIRYLRSKIDNVFSVNMIRTVRGVGYVINAWEG